MFSQKLYDQKKTVIGTWSYKNAGKQNCPVKWFNLFVYNTLTPFQTQINLPLQGFDYSKNVNKELHVFVVATGKKCYEAQKSLKGVFFYFVITSERG